MFSDSTAFTGVSRLLVGSLFAGWPAVAAAGDPFLPIMSISSTSSPAGWRQLPPYPGDIGVAGILAGRHDGVLIAAGGTNFPERPPWEGGKKRTYADVHVYQPSEHAWRAAGDLPEPRGYAAVVSVPAGVLVIGGENADKVFADSFWMQWDGRRVVTTTAPSLPSATTSPVAAVLGEHVYVASGYAAGAPRLSQAGFWRLDWRDPAAGWTELPAWPGPSRGQAVMAALGDSVYLFSGISIVAGHDAKPQVTYLSDAYRYHPAEGWTKLPDLPRSAIAAPSPSPVSTALGRIYVLGGVDGRLVGKQPRDTRVPDDIIYYDVATGAWQTLPGRWPDPVVTSPAVPWADEWIIVSGEIMSAVRTPHVWSWNPAAEVAR